MRHIWHDKVLHVNLRIRLYKACICSMLTYGSEAWNITLAVTRALNGANASKYDEHHHGQIPAVRDILKVENVRPGTLGARKKTTIVNNNNRHLFI